jgi:hypothetical protein
VILNSDARWSSTRLAFVKNKSYIKFLTSDEGKLSGVWKVNSKAHKAMFHDVLLVPTCIGSKQAAKRRLNMWCHKFQFEQKWPKNTFDKSLKMKFLSKSYF